ncbi:MAG: discoidin domain-containing protein [Sedimentisphaerales bacterium]|nr:discoidin domain-containing protein [Sedimentisphaerales bacterium]
MKRQSTFKLAILPFIIILGLFLAIPAKANITVVPASPFTGPEVYKAGYSAPQSSYRPYDTSLDLAYQGNGFAQAAVSKDTIAGYPNIHQAQYANDGYYGNAASWISSSANSWLKIDLGQQANIDSIVFGRDRLGYYNDRDPGQFTISVALSDNIYANGDESLDGTEYTVIYDSTSDAYSGLINGPESLSVNFTVPVSAQYLKITFANSGVAIDEVQVFGTAIPSPAAIFLGSIGVGIVGWLRKRRTL